MMRMMDFHAKPLSSEQFLLITQFRCLLDLDIYISLLPLRFFFSLNKFSQIDQGCNFDLFFSRKKGVEHSSSIPASPNIIFKSHTHQICFIIIFFKRKCTHTHIYIYILFFIPIYCAL